MTSTATTFVVIGERTNITGSPKFAKAVRKYNPRPLPAPAEARPLRLSGLEPLSIA